MILVQIQAGDKKRSTHDESREADEIQRLELKYNNPGRLPTYASTLSLLLVNHTAGVAKIRVPPFRHVPNYFGRDRVSKTMVCRLSPTIEKVNCCV